ncbi:methionine ABC transporter ATP-binding protein, partial [Stenotrophomonas sp. HMWF022]
MNEAAIIDLQGVQFGYADRAVLDIAQLQVSAGSSVLLRGTSGSGKSTLLGLLAGILLPGSGSIRVAGHAVNTLGAAARDRFRADQLGVIFQQFNLLPFLSVRNNIALGVRFSPLRNVRIDGGLDAEIARLLR